MDVYSGFQDTRIVVAGLGYVGLTLAVAMSEVGFRVHGVEVRDEVLEKLDKKLPHFKEPGLDERLKLVIERGRFSFSKTLAEPCSASVFIITVGTPIDAERRVRLDMIQNATQQIASVIEEDALVILRSTVKVGTARDVVAPILDQTGKRYELAVCPERTLEGRALEELREIPQVVGADDGRTVSRAAALFSFLTPTIVRVSPLEAAELIKLVDNTYRDVIFAFGNEVARLCNSIGVNAREVIKAGGLSYERTNVAYPGPVGGPCLEKDPYILAESVRPLGLQVPLIQAARWINEIQPQEVVDFLSDFVKATPGFSKTPTISLLGLAFKGRPETDDLRGTMARPVLAALRKAFPTAKFIGFDAVVDPKSIQDMHLTPALTIEAALKDADLAIFLNNHPLFASQKVELLCERMARPAVLYDFWGQHNVDRKSLPEGIAYISLGDHRNPILGEASTMTLSLSVGKSV